jgi:hypothetical protein
VSVCKAFMIFFGFFLKKKKLSSSDLGVCFPRDKTCKACVDENFVKLLSLLPFFPLNFLKRLDKRR